MSDCENILNCSFFTEYKQRKENQLLADMALKGLVNLYCKGEKQDTCVRKRVSKELRGPSTVPKNLMPHGFPIPGTNNLNWSNEVKDIIDIARREL